MLLVLAASPVPCPVGTAADYTAFGSTGCIDSIGTVFSNFAFSTNPSIPVPLGSIGVSPAAPDVGKIFGGFNYASGLSLTFSPAFMPTAFQQIDLKIGFTATNSAPPAGTFAVVDYYLIPEFLGNGSGLFFQNGTATLTDGGMTVSNNDENSQGSGIGIVCAPCSAAVDVRFDFPIWADTQGRGIKKFELAITEIPEGNTCLLVLSGLALVWRRIHAGY